MKEGAYVINCARGSVVDEEALYEALRTGHLGGAALDVMEQEPFDMEGPLLKLPNVVVTPHVGGVTRQAANRTHKMVVETTLRLLNGERIDNVANPEALAHAGWFPA